MGHNDERVAVVVVQVLDERRQMAGTGGIEAGGGLIQQNQRRLHGDNPRQSDPAHFPVAEMVDGALCKFGHLHQRHRLVHQPLGFSRAEATVDRSKRHIFPNMGAKQLIIGVLGQQPHPAESLLAGFAVQFVTAQMNLTTVRHQQSGHKIQQCGFAGTVGPTKKQHLTFGDLQGNIFQGPDSAARKGNTRA